MQSKGRARSKENASYVLFIDEPDVEAHYRDRTEYDNYEAIEKVCEFQQISFEWFLLHLDDSTWIFSGW